LVELEPLILEHWLQDLVRRSRISRRFQDHKLPLAHILPDLTAGRQYERHVWVLRLSKRCRDANYDHVAFCQPAKIRGRRELSIVDTSFKTISGNIRNIRTSAGYFGRLLRVDLEANALEAISTKFDDQRKADITQSDHTDPGAFFSDKLNQFCFEHYLLMWISWDAPIPLILLNYGNGKA